MCAQLMARATGNASQTPGPQSYNTAGNLGQNAPKFTFKGRNEIEQKRIDVPYRSIPSSVGAGPKYTLASRHSTNETSITPGPGYIPPPLGSDAKKSSMSFRTATNREDREANPGPGAYDIKPSFARESVSYTLKSRTNMLNDGQAVSPGPAAYNPDYSVTKKRAPSATMHVRTPVAKQDVTPGPSDYSLSRSLGGTSPTFHIRPKESTFINNPGPGQYTPMDSNLPAAPKYTLKGRHNNDPRPLTAPYRSLPSSIGVGPKYSLASRHATRDSIDTPGPAYIPPNLGADSRKSSMASRHPETRDGRTENPGPGAYEIEAKFAKEANKYTLKSRTNMVHDQSPISPGPAAYNPDYSAVKKRAPSATMHVRTEVRNVSESAGYVNLGSTLTGPKYTIGRRENLEVVPV